MKNEKQTKQPQGGRRSQARKTAKAKKKSSLPVKWIIGAVFVVIVLAYGIGVYHYKDHFHRDTYVNGISLGGMTLDEAERTFTDDLESHKIALEEKERTEIIDPQDIDTVISVGTQIEDLYKSQSPWNWFTHFFGKDESTVTLDVSFDEDKLEEVVDSLECFDKANVVAPEDAYIKAGETQFEIVPEVLGNTIKKNQLLEAIKPVLPPGLRSSIWKKRTFTNCRNIMRTTKPYRTLWQQPTNTLPAILLMISATPRKQWTTTPSKTGSTFPTTSK